MHTCLQEHRDELSPACRREEIKLMVRQAANVEFVPSISKTCREEMNVFCKVRHTTQREQDDEHVLLGHCRVC